MDVFLIYEEVASWVWMEVHKWDYIDRDTLGKQLIRSADSINANLVEADGRFSDKEAVHHFYIAPGAARETRLHLRRARDRGLVDRTEANSNLEKLTRATKLLNLLIRYRKHGLVVRESGEAEGDPFAEELS